MTHLCCTDNLPSVFALILHDSLLLCSFFISHPLIPAYLLLLSPYLLKILFLLYPLLLSTSLLLLALLTVSSHLHENSSTSPESSPATTSSALLNFLRAELVADVSLTEQLCAMVFADFQLCSGDQMNQFVSFSQYCSMAEDARDRAEDEDLSEKREEEKEEGNAKAVLRSREEHRSRASEILQRDGSMRREKEWKRTLACKLFEERMTYKLCEERKVVEGAEEMDLLWEAYEVDADKAEKQRKGKDASKAAKEKVQDEEEGEEEEEEGISGQLCCLQALKLSAGKMNLGVGRPSLVKISMALKGMVVFQRTGRRRKITR